MVQQTLGMVEVDITKPHRVLVVLELLLSLIQAHMQQSLLLQQD
jgi:hypothetical protein